MKQRGLAPWLVAALLAAAPLQAGGYSAQERAFVMALFEDIQLQSFALGVEFCGFLFRDERGKLRTTRPEQGRASSCAPRWPRQGTAIASWHTHGAYDPDSWNEVPSGQDVETDNLDGVDGWVATPGGRLWHVDGERMISTLVCDLRCLPSDPHFVKGSDGEIRQRYTYKQLLRKLDGS